MVRGLHVLVVAASVAAVLSTVEARQQPASDPAKSRALASQLVEEATALRAKQDAASLHQSAAKLQQAIALWQEAGDRAAEANAINLLASTRLALGDAAAALDGHTSALAIARAAHSAGAEAAALNGIGRVRDSWGDYD